MEEKQLMEVDEKEVAIIQFFRSLSNEQKETFCDFLITLKQFLNDEKSWVNGLLYLSPML